MCVIVIVPAGRNLPTKSDLRKMYNMNHDGCGFVSKSTTYHSMDFEDFYGHLKAVPKSEPCIIHFRWATHGSVNIKNTHPFYDKATDTYFAHNGILSVTPQGDKTDSETAFRKYLVPAIKKGGYDGDDLRYAVHKIIGGSKFAFMHEGKIRLFGHFEEYGGCLYSNLRHLPYSRAWFYGS